MRRWPSPPRARPLASPLEGLDVVHYALTLQLPRLGLPKAVTLQDLQHLDLPQLLSRAERRFRRPLGRRCASADAVIVPSQFVRRGIVEHLGVPPERVHSIPHGVDHDRFFPTGEPREAFLLYPARPWPHKNHERLFEAFALLRRERPELELVLTGGGHEGRAVRRASTVRGPISVDELVSLYRRAACLVFPSLYEGFGYPPLEAMACGCPRRSLERRLASRGGRRRRGALRPDRRRGHRGGRRRGAGGPERVVAAGLEQVAPFTWAETARRHEAVYRSL